MLGDGDRVEYDVERDGRNGGELLSILGARWHGFVRPLSRGLSGQTRTLAQYVGSSGKCRRGQAIATPTHERRFSFNI